MSDNKPEQLLSTGDESQAEKLTGHCYDGIQEYDNPTPAWWTWLFMGSCVFAVIYLFYVFAAQGVLSPHGQYERAYVANVEKKFGTLGDLEPDAATIIKYTTDEEWMAFARNVFKVNCASCHGAEGEGITGPNLTDETYIHIENVVDIARIVREGANAGAMPPHETRLHPNEIVLVASYVASIRGTNVAGGKSAEGDFRPEPWSE